MDDETPDLSHQSAEIDVAHLRNMVWSYNKMVSEWEQIFGLMHQAFLASAKNLKSELEAVQGAIDRYDDLKGFNEAVADILDETIEKSTEANRDA